MEEIKENKTKIEEKYSKENLYNSLRYKDKKDLINALLENDKKYTLKQVESILDAYLKGGINNG